MNRKFYNCQHQGCENKHYSNGYCIKHNAWIKRYGTLDNYVGKSERVASKHPLWNTYNAMKQRCYYRDGGQYKDYGGRGIKVCERWLENFWNFVEDMFPSYKNGLTIDRINNDGDYEPSNCRWLTLADNVRNSRSAKLTITDVENIRRLFKSGISCREINKLYPVLPSALYKIRRNETWAQ